MKIAVLGGTGLMASGTIRDLISEQSDGIEKVYVADIDEVKISNFIKELNDDRLEGKKIDVKDESSVLKLLEKADLCINGVPTFAGYQMDIFNYCFKAGCHYVDFGGMGVYTVKQKAEHDKWANAGLVAVLGLGADPGMSNMTCKAVAEELETIESINLYWAATIKGEQNPVLIPPYSIKTVMGEYTNNSTQFLDGKLTEMPPMSGVQKMVLPEPWGETYFMHSQHSEPLTVPFAKGIREKGIKEMTWRLSLPKEEDLTWKALVRAGFNAEDKPVLVNGVEVKPVELLEKLVYRNIEENSDSIPDQEGYEIHFAIGKGVKAGKNVTAKCTVTSGPDPLYEGYNDAGTSMNCSIGAQLLMRNQSIPGVWGPEEYYDVAEYFAEVKKRHFKVEMEIITKRAF